MPQATALDSFIRLPDPWDNSQVKLACTVYKQALDTSTSHQEDKLYSDDAAFPAGQIEYEREGYDGIPEEDRDTFHQHFNLAQDTMYSLYLAASKTCGFDLYEAYVRLTTYGPDKVYRPGKPKSWKGKVEEGLDLKRLARKIHLPADVLYLAALSFFGSDAFTEALELDDVKDYAYLRRVMKPGYYDFAAARLPKMFCRVFLAQRVTQWMSEAGKRCKECMDLERLLYHTDPTGPFRRDFRQDLIKYAKQLRHWSKTLGLLQPLLPVPAPYVDAQVWFQEHSAKGAGINGWIQSEPQDPPDDVVDNFENIPVTEDMTTGGRIHRQLTTSLQDASAVDLGVWQFDGFTQADLFDYAALPRDAPWPRLRSRHNGELILPRLSQITGAVEIVNRAYAGGFHGGSDDGYSRGVIVADETSVGKTLQALMVIALISHYAEVYRDPETDRTKLPSIMRLDRASWRRLSGDVQQRLRQYWQQGQKCDQEAHGVFAHTAQRAPPQCPHLIVCPTNMLNDWRDEIERFSDILRVHTVRSTMEARTVAATLRGLAVHWREHYGGWQALHCPQPADHIMLIGHNTFSALYGERRGKKTLFDGLQFNCFVFDEIQYAKNTSRINLASNLAASQSHLTIGQTATPLTNDASDLCYIAHALDLPEASNITAKHGKPAFFMELNKDIRQARRATRARLAQKSSDWYTYEADENPAEQAVSVLGGTSATSLVPFPTAPAALQEAAGRLGIASLFALDSGKCLSVQHVYRIFAQYIMRRSKVSQDGRPAIPLGTLKQSIVYVHLTDEEKEDIRVHLLNCEDIRVARGQAPAYDRLTFFGPTYLIARAANLSPFFYRHSRLPRAGEIGFTRAPTKIQAALDIIRATEISEKGLPIQKRSKFVICLDSLVALPSLVFEFARQGRYCRTLSGRNSLAERQLIVKEVSWHEDHPADPDPYWSSKGSRPPKTRILVLLPVGNVGINLWRCNCMIQIVYQWSEANRLQLIGRVHRSPPNPSQQPLDVSVYSIIAVNSVDVVMMAASMTKGLMKVDKIDVLKGKSEDWRRTLTSLLQGEQTRSIRCQSAIQTPQAHPAVGHVNLATHFRPHPLPASGSFLTVAQRARTDELGVSRVFDRLYTKRAPVLSSAVTSHKNEPEQDAPEQGDLGTKEMTVQATAPARPAAPKVPAWKQDISDALAAGIDEHWAFQPTRALEREDVIEMVQASYAKLHESMRQHVLKARAEKRESVIDELRQIRVDLQHTLHPEIAELQRGVEHLSGEMISSCKPILARLGHLRKRHRRLVQNDDIENDFRVPDPHYFRAVCLWLIRVAHRHQPVEHLPPDIIDTEASSLLLSGHLHHVKQPSDNALYDEYDDDPIPAHPKHFPSLNLFDFANVSDQHDPRAYTPEYYPPPQPTRYRRSKYGVERASSGTLSNDSDAENQQPETRAVKRRQTRLTSANAKSDASKLRIRTAQRMECHQAEEEEVEQNIADIQEGIRRSRADRDAMANEEIYGEKRGEGSGHTSL